LIGPVQKISPASIVETWFLEKSSVGQEAVADDIRLSTLYKQFHQNKRYSSLKMTI
jgi:hypothetical protein